MAKGISGVGVGMMAAGGLVIWSGINNAGILESLRALAKGQAPPKHPKAPFQPVTLDVTGTAPVTTASSSTIVIQAMKHQGKHPYRYGAGHSKFACGDSQAEDCSAFVSCVFHELGALDHPLNTTGFLMWMQMRTVPFDQRAPGDVIIWPNHMGIIVDTTHMIHTGGASGCPCVVTYTQMRHGGKGIVRRWKSSSEIAPAQKTR